MAYADIDAGKVLNKAGLLELSSQIKSYVDANVPDVDIIRVPLGTVISNQDEISQKLMSINYALNNGNSIPHSIIMLGNYPVIHMSASSTAFPSLWVLRENNNNYEVFIYSYSVSSGYNGGYVITNGSSYTLPTASTSTLGGVKVDGSTITINDGVISAVSENLVFNTAYDATTNKIATMADIPNAYTLPTASTSTLGGVKVDGTTITITDGVISANVSGGSGGGSYTAGRGIDIDANNVISVNRIDNSAPLWLALSGISTDWSYFSQQITMISNNDTQEKFLTSLLNGEIVYVVASVYWNGLGTTLYNLGYIKVITLNNNGSYQEATITQNMSNWRPDRRYDYWLCGKIIMRAPHTNYNDIFGVGLGKLLPYDNTASGLTASTIKGAIDEVVSNMNTRIPTAPTTDGNYVLKVVVADGTPTYSWVAET